MRFTIAVELKPVLILMRRRAARRAESALTTVVLRGGDGFCSVLDSSRPTAYSYIRYIRLAVGRDEAE